MSTEKTIPTANIGMHQIQLGCLEYRYKQFRYAMTESAQLVLPVVEGKAKQKWMTAPILPKMDQRRLTKGNEALYNLLDIEIRQECKAAKKHADSAMRHD